MGLNVTEYMNATDLPDGVSGPVEVKRVIVDDEGCRLFKTMEATHGRRTALKPGTYCGMYINGHLWMSDTPDEAWDHAPVIYNAQALKAKRALINGLGIGMVVNALLHEPSIEHIDVVEIDKNVIALVEPHYQQLAAAQGKTITIHNDDAYTIKWPPGTKWDVAWHDIWLSVSTDNLAEMSKLHRRYGGRVRWQQSWKRAYLLSEQRRERDRGYLYGWR